MVSVGYNLIYGVLRFINFAHGEVVTAAAFLLFFFFSQLNLPLYVSVALAVVLTSALGLAINRFVYKPLRNAPPLSLLAAAIAVSLILQSLILIFFTANARTVQNPFPSEPIVVFGASITPVQLAILFVSLFFMLLVELFLTRTKTGKEIRATADNPELARTIGINTEHVIALTFLFASALAAVAGMLVSFEHPISFLMGVNLGIRAFAASVIGGIGSIYGSFIGGYFLGMAENLGILFLPSGYKDAIGFFLLIVFLLFRPSGILKTEVRKV